MTARREVVVVPTEGAMHDRILDEGYATANEGLSRTAYGRFHAAQMKIAWGHEHQRRFALTTNGVVLASVMHYQMAGFLDQRPVRICGIGSVCVHAAHDASGDGERLVERLLENATHDGADCAVLFSDMDSAWCDRVGFERLRMPDVELGVAKSLHHGAPMTLVRAGEERDLAAIAAMGEIRASPFRFHLERGVDFVRYAIAKKRLLAGLALAGARQLQFFIAEEGITAAAYLVLTVEGSRWTIEECGDRDPSGARVGAILQGLIAREPVENRPTIRGWLPPGFAPPQLTALSTRPATETLMVRSLGSPATPLRLSTGDVLWWHGDRHA